MCGNKYLLQLQFLIIGIRGFFYKLILRFLLKLLFIPSTSSTQASYSPDEYCEAGI